MTYCDAGSCEQDDPKKDIRLDAQLCFAIYRSANKVGRLYRQHLQPYGLTFPLYLVLLVLWEQAPCNVGDVVQALELETNSVTPLLKRLQSLGYVTRERDRVDERKVTIALTGRGEALRDVAVRLRTEFVDRSGMPYEQAVDLRTTLNRLSDAIDELMLIRRRPERTQGPARQQ